MDNPEAAVEAVRDGSVAGAVIVERDPAGGLDFRVVTIGGLPQDKLLVLQLGTFAVGVIDYTASAPAIEHPFQAPTFAVVDAGAVAGEGGGGTAVIDTAEYASRRIVGIVFVVLSFLTLVFYGLWVASGVVAEKASRVMELLISAATARQLVMGKILGIGLAGLTQVLLVLVPALLVMVASGRIGNELLGEDPTAATSLAGLSPGLVARVPRLLHARVRALRVALRGRGLAPEPRRGPADDRPAAVDPRDHGLPAGGPRAVRQHVRRSSGSRRTCRCGARS